jgi:hypothetical protein
MKLKKVLQSSALSILALMIIFETPAPANNQPPVSTVFAVVEKRLDIKSANLDQEVSNSSDNQ